MADQDEFKDPLRVFQFMVEAETSSAATRRTGRKQWRFMGPP